MLYKRIRKRNLYTRLLSPHICGVPTYPTSMYQDFLISFINILNHFFCCCYPISHVHAELFIALIVCYVVGFFSAPGCSVTVGSVIEPSMDQPPFPTYVLSTTEEAAAQW